jgi:hypothetical protein
VNGNPWRDLPDAPPFVLPGDEAAVQAFNLTANLNRFLHIDEVLPEPFVGDKEAPVVLLANNPGFSEAGLPGRQAPGFIGRMRDNLHHRAAAYPFVYLAPEFSGPSKGWWEGRLRHLLERFGPEVVAKSVLAVDFFPYSSRRYGHGRLPLPSQQYSFDLVRNAVKREAVIILMRGQRRWLEAVRELRRYGRFIVMKNLQRATISPGNCPRFEDVIRAIEAALPGSGN